MLVLSRYLDESIYIGSNVTITILEIIGNSVRIGIEAPVEVPVHREEIYRRIQDERSHTDE